MRFKNRPLLLLLRLLLVKKRFVGGRVHAPIRVLEDILPQKHDAKYLN